MNHLSFFQSGAETFRRLLDLHYGIKISKRRALTILTKVPKYIMSLGIVIPFCLVNLTSKNFLQFE